jgi:hypothetical protein
LSFHPEVPQVVDLREPKNLHSFYLSPFITIMNRTLRSFRVAFLGLLLVLTGCLTIEEQYTFKKDGSGTMTYIVDMSEMGEMMKGLGKMSESLGEKDQEPMMDMDDEAGELKTIPGISKVKVNKKKEWVRSIGQLPVQATWHRLNAALNVLMKDSTNSGAHLLHVGMATPWCAPAIATPATLGAWAWPRPKTRATPRT